jgi:hypothetical protein
VHDLAGARKAALTRAAPGCPITLVFHLLSSTY